MVKDTDDRVTLQAGPDQVLDERRRAAVGEGARCCSRSTWRSSRRSRPRRRPRRRPAGGLTACDASRSVTRHALRRPDPVPGDLLGLPDAEPAQAGDPERAWSRSTCGTSATGRRASTRASTTGPSAAAPAWCIMLRAGLRRVEAVQADAAEPGQLVMLTPAGERLTQPVVQELATQQAAAAAVRPLRGLRRAHPAGLAAARDLDRRLRLQRRRGAGDGGDRHGDPLRARRAGRRGRASTEESHSDGPGRLEYPQYTRPRVFRGMAVPEILLSGNHQAIARWRREQSELRSRPRDEADQPTGDSPERT